MAYNVGEVEVTVVPNAQTFNDKLASQVNPQADRLGKQIGDTLAAQIAQGIRKGLGDFPSDNPAKDPARRKGDEAAGAFGDAFKARLRAAMADLPDVKIGADSSDVDRALAAVRSEMQSLHDARLGIDLSDAEALAKLDELKAKLAEIGTGSDSVRVKADTAAATAELAKFQVELDKINGETATAKVKVDDGGGGSYNGVNSLVGALAMVAPAIVPIGAAAAAGAVALGSMAAVGVGAAGILAIAFKGVSSAMTLLGQQQTQQQAASQAQAQAAPAQAQAIVSAQRQVQAAQMALGDAQRNAAQQQVADAQAVASAQTALGDARRNAANQEISDNQAVQSAQQSLAMANDQVRLAQLALTAAQEAGRRELESYANNAADAALAQRQAVITLETAQANYSKTMSTATATSIQRQQATLDVAKAQQSLIEANQRAAQSTQDNTAAQAKGLSGTQAVTSAQKQLTTAQQTQQKATQTLADAQRKAANDQITSNEAIAKAAQALTSAQQKAANDQITSHESIVRAQQGVAAAADAMAAAQRQSAGTTNAALAATNAAIAKLDPATRNFAEYLRGTWGPIWKNVQSAAAGGLLPGVKAGMDALIPVMPGITQLIGNLATTMGDLFKQAGQALASPFWQRFITDIAQAGGPLLSNLAHIMGNIVSGIAGIIDAFLPMTGKISDGLAGLTQKFADWGQNLANNPGFHDFINYVQQAWPTIKQIVENVATAIGHVVSAGAGLGGGYLDALKTLSGILASLPVPVVEAMVAAFTGFKVASIIAGPLDGVAKTLKGIGLTDAAGTLGKVAGALPGIGIALGVIVPLIPAFFDFLKGTPSVADKAAGSVQGIADALAATNGQIDESVRKQVALKIQQVGLADAASKWGLTTKDLVDAITGVPGAMDKVKAAAGQYSTAIDNLGGKYGNLNDAQGQAKKKSEDELQAILNLGGGVADNTKKQQDLITAVYGSVDAHKAMETASGQLQDAVAKSGVIVQRTWDNNTAVLGSATDQQIRDLEGLGFTVKTLPDGKVVVTSDTGPARDQIDQMIRDYSNRVIAIAGGNFGPAAARLTSAQNAGGTGFSSGGYTGPGGKYEPAGVVHKGEFVVPQEAVNRIGVSNLAAMSGLPGYAAGGLVGPTMYANFPAQLSAMAMQQSQAIIDNLAAAARTKAAAATAVPDVGPVGNGMTWPALDRIRQALFPGSVLTSAYRPGAADWHGRGDAIDIGVPGNTQAGLMPIAAKLAQLYPGSTELIHNPNGSIKNGTPVGPGFWGPATWAQHANHVHWAMTPNALAAAQGQLGAGGGGGRALLRDQGGLIPPGYHTLYNGTGHNEVIAPQQTFQQVVNKMHDDAGGKSGARSVPLMQIQEQHIHHDVDMDLLLQQADYRQRSYGGVF